MAGRVRKIDVPPVVTQFVFDTLGFLGRHVANGVKAAKSSLLREASAEFKRRGEELSRAADENDGRVKVDVEVVDDKERR